MKTYENFMVLDTEGMSSRAPYEIGYIITTRDPGTFPRLERAFHFPENDGENYCAALDAGGAAWEMTRKTLREIEENPALYFRVNSVEIFREIFENDVKTFHVSKIYAYNANFDRAALKRLFHENETFSRKPENAVFAALNWYDIYSAAFYALCISRKYTKWAQSFGFMTGNGRAATTAEAVYNYLRDNIFPCYYSDGRRVYEKHEALADARLENEILQYLFSRKQKLEFQKRPNWRLLETK